MLFPPCIEGRSALHAIPEMSCWCGNTCGSATADFFQKLMGSAKVGLIGRHFARVSHYFQRVPVISAGTLENPWTDWNPLNYSINGVSHNDVKWIGTPGSPSHATQRGAGRGSLPCPSRLCRFRLKLCRPGSRFCTHENPADVSRSLPRFWHITCLSRSCSNQRGAWQRHRGSNCSMITLIFQKAPANNASTERNMALRENS